MELKRCLEERAGIHSALNELTAKAKSEQDRAFTPDELQQFDRMMGDFNKLTEKIETLKRCETLGATKTEPTQVITNYKNKGYGEVTRKEKDLAFKYWSMKAARQESFISDLHRAAADKVGVEVRGSETKIPLHYRPSEITRAQSSQLVSEGGALMNDAVFQGLERNLKFFGGARQIATVIRSGNGEPKKFAFGDDTAQTGRFVAQNPASGGIPNTSLTYQQKSLGAYEYVSAVYPVSISLLEDADIDVAADVGDALGIRLGRGLNPYYTSGTGASCPRGFMTDATKGTTAAGSTIAYDDLCNLHFSIDRAYRDGCKWTLSDTTLNALWQLVDGNQRPLFWGQLHSLAEGNPLNIFGHEIVINNDMDSVATTKKPICFIDPGAFKINDVKDIRILVLDQRYLDQLAVGYFAYIRTDSLLINPNRAKYMQMP